MSFHINAAVILTPSRRVLEFELGSPGRVFLTILYRTVTSTVKEDLYSLVIITHFPVCSRYDTSRTHLPLYNRG